MKRRLVSIVIFAAVAARLVLLARDRGAELVLRSTLLITGLALGAWLFHLTLHELAHFAASRFANFELRGLRFGPLLLDFTGPRMRVGLGLDLSGGVNALPRGAAKLATRLRWVAAAGPLMTASVTLVLWLVWRGRAESLASPLGVFVVMGGFTLFTALIPGALLPSPPASGTDLEQMLLPRRVLAHWTNAAALQAVIHGARLSAALDLKSVEALLPASGEVEGLELGWSLACLDAGDLTRGRERLKFMASRLGEDSPAWLRTDTMNQLGCLAAFDGDVVYAQACLAQVKETASADWYCELLNACIAKARGEDWKAPLEKWQRAVDPLPGKVFALAGNEWVLKRLSP